MVELLRLLGPLYTLLLLVLVLQGYSVGHRTEHLFLAR